MVVVLIVVVTRDGNILVSVGSVCPGFVLNPLVTYDTIPFNAGSTRSLFDIRIQNKKASVSQAYSYVPRSACEKQCLPDSHRSLSGQCILTNSVFQMSSCLFPSLFCLSSSSYECTM